MPQPPKETTVRLIGRPIITPPVLRPHARLCDALDAIDALARETCEERFGRMRLRIACKWNHGMQDDRIREEMEFLCSMQFRMPVVLGGRVLSHDEIALLTMTPDGYARFKAGR